jgi:hypothetical protein
VLRRKRHHELVNFNEENALALLYLKDERVGATKGDGDDLAGRLDFDFIDVGDNVAGPQTAAIGWAVHLQQVDRHASHTAAQVSDGFEYRTVERAGPLPRRRRRAFFRVPIPGSGLQTTLKRLALCPGAAP